MDIKLVAAIALGFSAVDAIGRERRRLISGPVVALGDEDLEDYHDSIFFGEDPELLGYTDFPGVVLIIDGDPEEPDVMERMFGNEPLLRRLVISFDPTHVPHLPPVDLVFTDRHPWNLKDVARGSRRSSQVSSRRPGTRRFV